MICEVAVLASAVLTEIKRQESEDALLESEPDASIRTMRCVGLCMLARISHHI